MTELDPSARRLIELACGQDEADPTTLKRLGTALHTKIALGAPLAKPARPVGSASVAVKSLRVLGVVSALAGGGWIGMRVARTLARVAAPGGAVPSVANSVQAPPSPNALAGEPKAKAPLELAPEASPTDRAPSASEPQPASPRPEPAKAHLSRKLIRANAGPPASGAATPAESTDELRTETAALRRAQEALRDGSPAEALSRLDEQDARFRHGRLQEERAAARVLALCQAGRATEARAQATRFERTWPRSNLRARIQSACWAP